MIVFLIQKQSPFLPVPLQAHLAWARMHALRMCACIALCCFGNAHNCHDVTVVGPLQPLSYAVILEECCDAFAGKPFS